MPLTRAELAVIPMRAGRTISDVIDLTVLALAVALYMMSDLYTRAFDRRPAAGLCRQSSPAAARQ
jgi:hypothetical protein